MFPRAAEPSPHAVVRRASGDSRRVLTASRRSARWSGRARPKFGGGAEGRDARLADLPHLVEAPAASRAGARDPVGEEPAMERDLVLADLLDGDRLLVEEALD